MQILDNGFVRSVLVSICTGGAVLGGSTIISNSRTLAVHEQRINAVEKLPAQIDALNANVQQLTVQVAVLNERLKKEDKSDGKKQ